MVAVGGLWPNSLSVNESPPQAWCVLPRNEAEILFREVSSTHRVKAVMLILDECVDTDMHLETLELTE